MYSITTATQKIAALTKRLRFIQGGTSAGKTVGVLEFLIDLAQRDTKPTLTSIMAESFPHLRRGAMKDFLSIMTEQKYFKDARWNKTESTYTFETGSRIEFFSVDQADKVRGARRDRGFLNEANNNSFQVFEQLEVRTSEFMICDWNPSSEFWFNTEIEGKRTDYEHIILNYLDNEALQPSVRASIEQRRDRKSWWTVYGLGLLGDMDERVYRDWKIVDEVDHNARLISYGLDFGYTNDPAVIVAIYYLNGGYIVDELAYTLGLHNRQLADILLALPSAPVIADSAEPKSVDEMRLYGLTMMNATKGKGSVSQGIDFVQAQRMSITKRSVNVIKSYRNYCFIRDKNDKITNEPDHLWSDGMDSVRYGMQIKQTLTPYVPYVQLPYEAPGLQTSQEIDPTPAPMPFTPHRL